MEQNSEYTVQTIEYYNAAAEKFELSPIEFLVWHALFYVCNNTSGTINHYYTASVADIARAIKIQRETVRRAILNLHEKGLAKRIGERWLFQAADNE